MKRFVAIVGIVGLGLAWTCIPAGAGVSAPFQSTPATGPPGTVIHTGDNDSFCDSSGDNARVQLIDATEHVVAEGQVLVPVSGNWAIDITVPLSAAPGDYILTATCLSELAPFSYVDRSFTVTVAAATTTTSTTVAPTTTTTTVPPVVPQAPVPAPVVASATLTG